MPLLRTTSIATAIMVLPFTDAVQAANWQSSVVVPTSVEYDSNPLLLSSEEKGVTRTIIAPDYTLVGTFDRDELRLGLGMHVLRSSDTDIVDDREDPNVSLGWQRDTEKGRFGLVAQYNESSTLSGIVQDTGVVTTDGTQKLYTLAGNWSSAITARSTLSNETKYSRARYDINTLTGYNELGNVTTWTYAWNERADVYTRFGVRRYEPEQDLTATASNSYTPAVGVKYQFSERLSADAHVGVNQVSGSEGGRRGEGGASLLYTGVRSDLSLSAERSTVASAEGGFAELDMVRGIYSYAVNELTRVGADATWQDSKGQTPNTLQMYSVWASREFSPFWDLRLSLMYKERRQDDAPTADATIVGLTLTYRYPDL
ncbi:hypothetical protein V7V80_08790 [Pseudomonas kermanshahensis]|uniref:DUF560 domain-containing protein n=1 Tax=Pseudomonas kermanshahensis TaxID=2745482 RepID=A0ABU8R4F9_9PSED|nr:MULTISPECIES: hypothetical protein [Pseudomonas]ATP44889.1 hypothetical protein CR511_12845 [Pseudomonas putida]ATP50448.1 hypothetical protein CR512_14130 [Pseudomonas putida]MBC3484759.1 hypothetical protein [Pseudomonas sp. SWRI50]MBC3495283.1 hypothetical protein [Pseudomonas sp. SWRI67]MBV4527041.1 hypothetical protein [Pseudomonas kermanshahensis]